MKQKINTEERALYFRLLDTDILESEEIQPGIVIDYDKDGNFVGIEILDLSNKLPLEMLKNFQFELEAEEQNNGVYVGYKFDGKTLFERSLEWEEIDLVEYDEENDCYLFNGEEIESEAEQYEILLSAKPFQEVVKPQINQ